MILKLKPACKNYVWGGHRLVEDYGVEYEGERLAEAWALSCHPDGASVIDGGEFDGKTLIEYIASEGREVLGENCRRFRIHRRARASLDPSASVKRVRARA